MEEGEDLSFEELKQMEEERITVDSSAHEVNDGLCNECGGKLIKIVENRSLLDGAITFHIIKLRCEQCGKEYADLNQAEKYDLLFTLEQAIKSKRLFELLRMHVAK